MTHHPKRRQAILLLQDKLDEALAANRGTLANVYAGQIYRINAGRYDHRLDEFIAELREPVS
jgi:hypothetical protein